MKKIAIIGAGGINSWVIKHLHEICKIFEQEELIYVKIFDNDTVEEKNLLRLNQNFLIEDLMLQKAEILAKRYNFDFENCFITKENVSKLQLFDDIILGVDNNKTRQIIYEYCWGTGKYLLDLRANGTNIAYFIMDKAKSWDYYNDLHFSNKELMERKGSCQLQEDITNDHIQSGNKIIAFMGIWGVWLKRLRGEKLTTNEWRFVY